MKANIINTIGNTLIVATFLTIILLFTVFNNGTYIAPFFLETVDKKLIS